MATKITPPTKQEIDNAFDIFSRYTEAQKASGRINARERAFQKFRETRKELSAECEETAESLYQQMVDVLPEGYRELLGIYGVLIVAPSSITKDNIKLFRSFIRKAKGLLEQFEQAANPKRGSMQTVGAK